MSAQTETLVGLPDLKIGLEGTFDALEVVNRSDRTIIGYILHVEDDRAMRTNIPYIGWRAFRPGAKDVFIRVDDLAAAKAAGRQAFPREVHKDGSPVVVSRISLDSVIFTDGEFAGPDAAQFYRFAVAHIDATREFAVQALADMTRIQTAGHSSRNASVRERLYRRGKAGEQMIATKAEDDLAEELYGIQQSDGIEAARQATERLSKLPKLWRGGK